MEILLLKQHEQDISGHQKGAEEKEGRTKDTLRVFLYIYNILILLVYLFMQPDTPTQCLCRQQNVSRQITTGNREND